MNDDRFADDRILSGQAKLSLPIEMRLARRVGGNVAKIAFVMIEGRRSAVMFLGRIEMCARR